MTAHLAKQSYGKSQVRLTKVTRTADRHDLRELAINIALEGDFASSYLTGDNASIVATDTMKNTVYALAAEDPILSPESFAQVLTNHFLSRNSHISMAAVGMADTPWERIATETGLHRHSFSGSSSERRISRVQQSREQLTIQSGITGLGLLKTTDSAFKGFLRDEFTTLAEAEDRIFATLLDATWTYASTVAKTDPHPFDFNDAYQRLRKALIAVFADHYSLSVQQTMFAMGEKALEICPEITNIELSMPNQHRIPINLTPLGKENRNEIFVTTSEPYGFITATITRDKE